MDNETIKKSDIMKYGFYDSNGKYTIILNEQKIKELFEAEQVYFVEPACEFKN